MTKISKKKKYVRLQLVALCIVVFLIVLISLMSSINSFENKNQIPLSRVVDEIKLGKVTEIDVLHTRLLIKEGDITYTVYTEPNFNLYQLLEKEKIILGNTKIFVKDNSEISFWLDSIFSFVSAIIPILLMGAFFYLIYLLLIKPKTRN
jgi:ATP-dependent Zn protease